jgi:hypothetical protein
LEERGYGLFLLFGIYMGEWVFDEVLPLPSIVSNDNRSERNGRMQIWRILRQFSVFIWRN